MQPKAVETIAKFRCPALAAFNIRRNGGVTPERVRISIGVHERKLRLQPGRSTRSQLRHQMGDDRVRLITEPFSLLAYAVSRDFRDLRITAKRQGNGVFRESQ